MAKNGLMSDWKYCYFVSYSWRGCKKSGYGNTTIYRNSKITSYMDIETIRNEILDSHPSMKTLVILYWKKFE